MPISFASAIFWVAAACCLFAQIAILRSTFRIGSAAGHDPRVPRPHTAGELFWVLVPAVALALLLAATWRAVRPDPSRSGGAVFMTAERGDALSLEGGAA